MTKPKVTFQFIQSSGRFQTYDRDGNEVVVEAGKNFSTADPYLVQALDEAPHAVERVDEKKSKSADGKDE